MKKYFPIKKRTMSFKSDSQMNAIHLSLLKIVFIIAILPVLLCVPGCNKDDGDPNVFTDARDGQRYAFVTIGDQVWMAENLNFEIPGGNSLCADNNNSNCEIYGRLYNYSEALTALPDGWHLPSQAEWFELITFLGGVDIAGGKLKEAGLDHWLAPNEGADNSSGFTALPGGYYTNSNGQFNFSKTQTQFWTSTEFSAGYANLWELDNMTDDAQLWTSPKENAVSVRGIRD